MSGESFLCQSFCGLNAIFTIGQRQHVRCGDCGSCNYFFYLPRKKNCSVCWRREEGTKYILPPEKNIISNSSSRIIWIHLCCTCRFPCQDKILLLSLALYLEHAWWTTMFTARRQEWKTGHWILAYGIVYYSCTIIYMWYGFRKRTFVLRHSLLKPILGSSGVLIPTKIAMASTEMTGLHSTKG